MVAFGFLAQILGRWQGPANVTLFVSAVYVVSTLKDGGDTKT